MDKLILSTNILVIDIITSDAEGREYLPSMHRTLASSSSNTNTNYFVELE